jgi:YbgC/YbaW family acyl-CoA thioester hydrolase
MFHYSMTVLLNHTDCYGIIFFANQPIFCHAAFQAWLEHVGMPLAPDRSTASELMVIVRCESDYQAPVRLGDRLTIAYRVERIGTTSVTNRFLITNQHGVQVGDVRTVHVHINARTSAKIPLTPAWRAALTSNLGE